MKTNSNLNSASFNGKLVVLSNISKDFADVVAQNSVAKKILQGAEDLYIGAKMRTATYDEIYSQGRDDELYKVFFYTQKPVKSFADKISNMFALKQFLSSDYHSSSTNFSLIRNKQHLSGILSNLIKNN